MEKFKEVQLRNHPLREKKKKKEIRRTQIMFSLELEDFTVSLQLRIFFPSELLSISLRNKTRKSKKKHKFPLWYIILHVSTKKTQEFLTCPDFSPRIYRVGIIIQRQKIFLAIQKKCEVFSSKETFFSIIWSE